MNMTHKDKQVGNPDDFDGGTYGLAVSNECFATSKKLVRTKLMNVRLSAEGAQ